VELAYLEPVYSHSCDHGLQLLVLLLLSLLSILGIVSTDNVVRLAVST
jgi:hypothetical protein